MPTAKNKEELIAFVEDLKRQWMSTIDSLVDPLMIVRKDYTISKANLAMAKAAGQDIRNIIGKKCHKIFAGKNKPCKGCKMMAAAKSSKPQQFDLAFVRDDRFFEVTSQPIFDSDEKLSGVVQVYRDRTERKKLQEQLQQNEKLASIGLLAGGVAHELNNPLSGILVFSEMVQRELAQDSPHRGDVDEIINAAKRCKAIVESLLDFARTRPAHKKQDELHDVNINDAAQTALRFGRVSIPQHLVEITEDWSDKDIVIQADRNKLIQVFLNLYQNAIQAMPDGGTLSLRSYIKQANGAKFGVFEVNDTGVGIPEEHLKAIFDPFFTTKEPGEGTGLGLAICYGTVQELGGDIKIESKINEGTRFQIIFPLNKAALKRAG